MHQFSSQIHFSLSGRAALKWTFFEPIAITSKYTTVGKLRFSTKIALYLVKGTKL